MPRLPPVVDATWVRAHREVVLADVRSSLDPAFDHDAAYREGHLPGAVRVDLDRDLAAPPSPRAGRHPLPSPESFAEAMSRLGIADDDTVIAYDDGTGAYAARLVWMLRATGHESALLDGGLRAWDGELEAGTGTGRPRATFTPVPWPVEAVAEAEEVALAATGPASVVIDARAPERYRGEVEPVDPRAGHVPGAINVPFTGNVDETGRWRAPEDLRARFEVAGAVTAGDVIVYCGSGVTACSDVLALERAGIHARLFPGSWSAWSNDPDRPVATGAEP